MEERKRAEIEYPERVDELGREWLRTKPFRNHPRETRRHIADFAYVVQLLEPAPGMRVVELACGSGWLARLLARCGPEVTGYDISPAMVEIAREQAEAEAVEARFEAGDFETLDLGHAFDACVIYDGLHHSPQPDLVLACARRALRDGGRLLLSEPNWKHRFGGRDAAEEYGTTELGYSPRQLKRLLRDAEFTQIERFHNNRKRLYGNRPLDVAMHLAEPFVYRALGPWWTQVWLRAVAN